MGCGKSGFAVLLHFLYDVAHSCQVDNTALEITEGNIKQTVYVQNCSGKASRTVIQVDSIQNYFFIYRYLHTWVATGQVQGQQHYDRWLQQDVTCGSQVLSLHGLRRFKCVSTSYPLFQVCWRLLKP